jgi:hypothetical protein
MKLMKYPSKVTALRCIPALLFLAVFPAYSAYSMTKCEVKYTAWNNKGSVQVHTFFGSSRESLSSSIQAFCDGSEYQCREYSCSGIGADASENTDDRQTSARTAQSPGASLDEQFDVIQEISRKNECAVDETTVRKLASSPEILGMLELSSQAKAIMKDTLPNQNFDTGDSMWPDYLPEQASNKMKQAWVGKDLLTSGKKDSSEPRRFTDIFKVSTESSQGYNKIRLTRPNQISSSDQASKFQESILFYTKNNQGALTISRIFDQPSTIHPLLASLKNLRIKQRVVASFKPDPSEIWFDCETKGKDKAHLCRDNRGKQKTMNFGQLIAAIEKDCEANPSRYGKTSSAPLARSKARNPRVASTALKNYPAEAEPSQEYAPCSFSDAPSFCRSATNGMQAR